MIAKVYGFQDRKVFREKARMLRAVHGMNGYYGFGDMSPQAYWTFSLEESRPLVGILHSGPESTFKKTGGLE